MGKTKKTKSNNPQKAALGWLIEYFLDYDRDDDHVRDFMYDNAKELKKFIGTLDAKDMKGKSVFGKFNGKFNNAKAYIEHVESEKEEG